MPSIRYGEETLTLAEATARLTQRMLSRLAASIWDTNATDATLQRDIYQAIAAQSAGWLENRTTARQMTLLLEAQGIDLDTLLQDYHLKRYLERPDAYARQIGMHILWMPKGTLHSLSVLSDLLFALPHAVLRTGRAEVHCFVADTHPVTTPYTYWGVVSTDGYWYAVTVDQGVPTIGQTPPPGVNTAPGPHTLHWFTVEDEGSAIWYVTIQGDSLVISTTQPTWGYGTTEPFAVLDGTGQRWGMRVDSVMQVLVPELLDTGQDPITVVTPNHSYQAITLVDETDTPWWVSISMGMPILSSALPGGATDITPAGGPYRWLRLYDPDGGLWYGFPDQWGTWTISQTSPGDLGTGQPQALGDAEGVQWHLGVGYGEMFGISDAPNVDWSGIATALVLNDDTGKRWFWYMTSPPTPAVMTWNEVLPPNVLPQAPWGELGWLQVTRPDGGIRFLFPAAGTGAPIVAHAAHFPSFWGWNHPWVFRDAQGHTWALGVDNTDTPTVTPLAADDIPLSSPPLVLRDAVEACQHILPAGTLLTILVT